MSSRLHGVILVALAWGVYAIGIQAPFLLDDNVFITNPSSGVGDLWSFDDYRNRPVMMFSLSLNYAIAGAEPAVFRLVNILIHTTAALLLYGVVRRTLMLPRCAAMTPETARGVAFAVAALWVVHPLNTSAVTYVWQRCESQMGMFFLGAIYATLRAAEGDRRGLWTSLSILCCLLGFGSKETMVAVIPVLLIYDWVLISGSLRGALRARWPLYALFAVVVALGVTVVLPNTSTNRGGFSVWEYASNQPAVLVDYLRLALAPYPLCFDYGRRASTSLLAILPAALLVSGMMAFTVRQLMRRSWQGVGGAWFFLILAPTSSVIVINDLMCEYRMYLSLIPVIAFGVAGGRMLCARWNIAPGKALCGALVVYGGLTVLRNYDYRSVVSIWESSIAAQPENERAHYCLATPLLRAGEIDRALHHAQRACEIKKNYMTQWTLAEVLYTAGEEERALELCEACLKLRRRDPRIHQQIGRVCRKLYKANPSEKAYLERCLKGYRKSVKLRPKKVPFHEEFAIVCAGFGQMQEAMELVGTVLRLDPSREPKIAALALSSANNKSSQEEQTLGVRLAQLLVQVSGGRKVKPLVNFGRVLTAVGMTDRAYAVYSQAIGLPQVQNNQKVRFQIEKLRAQLPRR